MLQRIISGSYIALSQTVLQTSSCTGPERDSQRQHKSMTGAHRRSTFAVLTACLYLTAICSRDAPSFAISLQGTQICQIAHGAGYSMPAMHCIFCTYL